ncbi:Crp/Fnr family transcriptional regulator [Cohnella candidum]|uniref:Crp/Fnr family transcriptional regulator n=1 Tax=Cohnella candidum TaxID=2674991 RepID=A0A3G3JVP4_9BACL|nr:Crp/Fnr family transcriptional regulator [Cohnella candidum]AYQ72302.1 Crp/Fnr family transcriptional regulator [Cohnella candidum]
MREIKDQEQLAAYLGVPPLDNAFPKPLLPHLTLCRFERGERICSQGQKAEYLYVLVQGKIKIYTVSPEGKTLILSFKTPIELIGDIEYVRDIEIINTVEAVSEAVMIRVPYRWLRQYAGEHPPLLRLLLDVLARKFHLKSNSMRFNLMYPVEVRFASYLLAVSFDESDTLYEGRLGAVSLKDAANLIGTSYRHLNRVIRQLCADGLIERVRGSIRVKDRQGLRALAGNGIYE